jgi:putative transposase
MEAYVIHREEKRASKSARKHRRREKESKRAELNAHNLELRIKRRQQKKNRQAEDAAWREKKKALQTTKAELKRLSRQERRLYKNACQSQKAQRQADKSARKEQIQQRAVEDKAWREERQKIRSETSILFPAITLTTAWIAILVVVDNCTRQCIGVPLFTAGTHVTAEMVISALIPLCRPGLKHVISDNGPQFISEIFEHTVKNLGCLHVRIAPHRPCTNGIAERFVRTLKEWLEPRTWDSAESLDPLLAEFMKFYNDRPHQGRELKGLSPNEYSLQLKCSTC